MSQYLILIYQDEAKYLSGGEELFGQVMVDHQEFGQKYAQSLRGGEALHPTASATSIRADGDGGFNVTDGAFSETKEALGGYYVIEAADLDEALEIAKACPAYFGGVEVRPIMAF